VTALSPAPDPGKPLQAVVTDYSIRNLPHRFPHKSIIEGEPATSH
jgi:hypothetical protein